MSTVWRFSIALAVVAGGCLFADTAQAQCRSCGRHHSSGPKEAMVWPMEYDVQVSPDEDPELAKKQAYWKSKKIKNTPQYHYTGSPQQYYMGRSYKTFPHYTNWFTPNTQKRIDYRRRCCPWRPW